MMTSKTLKFISGLLAIALVMNSVSVPFVLAQSGSTFTTSVSTTEVDDVFAPTVPQDLTGTAVSPTQINLSWTASTDNMGVAGYRIYRNGTVIATTTNTIYIDSTATASTTYIYTVDAFDLFPNYSAQSAPVIVSTPDYPPEPPPVTPGTGGGSGGSTVRGLDIKNLVITPETDSALITFDTNLPTRARIFWGETSEYESGSIMSMFYVNKHELNITGLSPGTRYQIKIEATDYRGLQVSALSSFDTGIPYILNPLTNPTGFTANGENETVRLEWNNPTDPRFENVRIVKSDKFFPKDQYDGDMIYEGDGESFLDTDVIVGNTYYYAIFAKGNDGKYSSGALTYTKVFAKGVIQVTPSTDDPFLNIPDAENVHPRIKELKLSDFEFIQEGKLLPIINERTVAINGSINLTVRLKYDKVPEVLKTIAFTLGDPEDPKKVFPFLLRVNEDRTYYDATIGALGRSGKYVMQVVILDFKNRGMKRIQGDLQALAFVQAWNVGAKKYDPLGLLLLLLLLILILIAILLLKKRSERKNVYQY